MNGKLKLNRNQQDALTSGDRPIRWQKGSATVEAAIVLPLVILAIMSVLSIIRVTGTYERMQHALNQTAQDLSQYSYLYALSGLKDKHDALTDHMGDAKDELLSQQEAIASFYDAIKGVVNDAEQAGQINSNGIGLLFDSLSDLNQLNNAQEEIAEKVEEILKDPMGEVQLIGLALSEPLLSDAKTMLLGTIAKSSMKARLSNELNIPVRDLDERLRLQDGIEQIDFSCSTFFTDKETIDLIAEYTVKPMPDLFFLPEIKLRNRACVLAWTTGVDKETAESGSSNSEAGESIWNIDKSKNYTGQHLGRGNAVDKRYAEELKKILGEHAESTPYNFKTIDLIEYAHEYQDGSLILIFSLNPFLPSYQKKSGVLGEIKKNLYKLMEFEKAETKNYLIDVSLLEGNYKRIAYIVIPENDDLPEAYLEAFEEGRQIARSLNIELKQVQKYGEYEEDTGDEPIQK